MQAPVDYPLNDAAHTADFDVDELIYAAMLDRSETLELPAQPNAVVENHHPEPALVISSQARPSGFRSVPKPLAAIAQSLIAGQTTQRRLDPTAMFSRLARTAR